MSAADGIDVARAGQRIKTKVLVALVLSSVVPALVLVYLLLVLALPTFLQILLGLTITGMLTGAWVHWDLGRMVGRMGALMASERPLSGFEQRPDETGTLMTSFNKMLVTIEQQAAEINTFATRLDAAYKEVESTNARLKEGAFKDDITGSTIDGFFSCDSKKKWADGNGGTSRSHWSCSNCRGYGQRLTR